MNVHNKEKYFSRGTRSVFVTRSHDEDTIEKSQRLYTLLYNDRILPFLEKQQEQKKCQLLKTTKGIYLIQENKMFRDHFLPASLLSWRSFGWQDFDFGRQIDPYKCIMKKIMGYLSCIPGMMWNEINFDDEQEDERQKDNQQ